MLYLFPVTIMLQIQFIIIIGIFIIAKIHIIPEINKKRPRVNIVSNIVCLPTFSHLGNIGN